MSSKPWLEYSDDEKTKFLSENSEDCKFRVGMDGYEEPKEFKSFKVILCSISPVFDRMFNGDFKEAKDSEQVVITDIFACDFESFLDLVYFRKVNITRSKKLYDIVKKYMAEQYVNVIIYGIVSQIQTPVEALQYYEIMFEENREVCIRDNTHFHIFFLNSVGKLLCEAFDNSCSYIANMSPQIIRKLLAQFRQCENLKPEHIFQTIANLEGKVPSKDIKLIMNGYDFSKMSINDFLVKVEPSNAIDEQMKYKILISICRFIAKK